MITTRIVWEQNTPSQATVEILLNLQKEKDYRPLLTKTPIEGTTDTAYTRAWDDLESAQEWVNTATQLGAKSAEIITE
jgi:hypothetical protein